MKIGRTRRKAVAPVLATLMMIAVAVAMSVIIFVWSQGFLSQTSSAAGGQQSQQNIAAQSSVSIESSTFTGVSSGTATLILRNVGSVAITPGSLLFQGAPTNSGFQGSAICTNWTTTLTTACTGVASVTFGVATVPTGGSATSFPKGTAAVITITFGSVTNTYPISGDLINIKFTTTAGTFATQQFTVP